jgi:AraC family L-rhamnose operon regulatory protein RhaS
MVQFSGKRHFRKKGIHFWVQRNFHDWNSPVKLHSHDFVELVYVVRGKAQHRFEGDVYEIRTGDVFIINPGEEHAYDIVPGNELEIVNCLFLPDLIEDSLLHELKITDSIDFFYIHPFLDKNERFHHHRLNLFGQESTRVLALLEEMIGEVTTAQPGYDTIIRLRLLELLILLSRYYAMKHNTESLYRSVEGDRLIRRICGYLERNYSQKISLESLTSLFNISVRQLNRLFKRETGSSVFEMIHRIRIERAKYLLTETDDKVISVAGAVGYDDPASFSRLFARHVGCPPGEYRKRFTVLKRGRKAAGKKPD